MKTGWNKVLAAVAVGTRLLAAGFKLAAEGRNSNDPRDKNTPDPPQPKDEFVLKFAKPWITRAITGMRRSATTNPQPAEAGPGERGRTSS